MARGQELTVWDGRLQGVKPDRLCPQEGHVYSMSPPSGVQHAQTGGTTVPEDSAGLSGLIIVLISSFDPWGN